jgi:hypothetical protein
MMIVVLVVALACGWVARQRRRKALLAAARTQAVFTHHFQAPVEGPNSHGESHLVFLDRSPGRLRWVWTEQAWSKSDGVRVIDVQVSGGFDGSDLEPLAIKDHGGTRNALLIEALARAYGERGWRYEIRIMPRRAPDLTRGVSSEL